MTLLRPKAGRDMDLRQIVTNDEREWSDRPVTDFGPRGITPETDVRIANQMRARIPDYIPQINLPLMSTDAYAKAAGQLWASQYTGDTIYLALGNEVWNVFNGNLGHWNLLQARAEGYQGDDFRVLGLRQGRRLAEHVKAFAEGAVGKRVVMIIEGFSPIPQYAQNQIDGMRAAGLSPAGARISIGQYAAGSATDLIGLLATDEQKRAALVKFIDDGPEEWTKQHAALAVANGLVGVVDGYEVRWGTKPVADGEIADWVRYQNTDSQASVQDFGWRRIVPAAGGAGAVLMVEGLYGFPMGAPQGQFPLLGLDQFNDPIASGAYRGTAGVIDFNVPEPSALVVAVALLACLIAGRRGRMA